MGVEPSLSLCMIVKDEELNIERCLRSVQHLVNEIIIVDTGSTDRTMEICRTYNAVIHSVSWNESFSEARNFGLGQAKGDWILWMDADEEFDLVDARTIYEAMEDSENKILLVQLINYYGLSPPDPHKAYLIAHHRLFRNHLGFKFVNPIHEQLNVEEVLGDVTLTDIQILPITIHHYGYMDDMTQSKNKSERNLNMLKIEKENENHSPWVDYHLASEYYRKQDYIKAFEQVNAAIMAFLKKDQLPPSLLYKLKYEVIMASGNVSNAWPSIDKAIALYPNYVDLHFYKGVIFFIKEEYEEARNVFLHCLQLGEGPTYHLTMRGVGSFHALYYIGQCYHQEGDYTKAAAYYAKVLILDPDHEHAKERLHSIPKDDNGGD